MTLYEDIISLLEKRMVANVDILSPLYICSIGSHMFNMVNKTTSVFMESGLLADARVHVIMVTVPGFGKSFMLRQFLEKDIGICWGTKINPKWAASMTTASFVGSIKTDKEGNAIVNPGIAQSYNNSIIGIHEFAEITKSMTLSYNVGLHDALLAVLDDGHVRKDVAAGGLDYITMLTLFTAVQPARYELSSGLGRRLYFLVYIPTYSDIDKFRIIRRKARYVKDDKDLLNKIRKQIDEKYETIKGVKSVRFSPAFYSWLDKNNIIPYEEILYERLAIGYTIMNKDIIRNELYIDIDNTLETIMDKQKKDRKAIKQGIHTEQVWRVIKNETKIEKNKLMDYLLEFSLSRQDILSRLKTLKGIGWIREDKDHYYVIKRPKKDNT